MTQAVTSDAGFSLVEILVALVIASLVVMGIGGLFLLTSSVQSRVREASRIEAALVELQGVRQVVGHDLGMRIADPSATGFTLVATTPQAGTSASQMLSHLVASQIAVEFSDGTRDVAVDLSAFESASLEYLLVDQTRGAVWQGPSLATEATAIGARLRLVLGGRVWRSLLWMVATFDATEGQLS